MKTDQIVMLFVALLLGMLLANMMKSVCGCKIVEGGNNGPGNNSAGDWTTCENVVSEATCANNEYHHPKRRCMTPGSVGSNAGNKCNQSNCCTMASNLGTLSGEYSMSTGSGNLGDMISAAGAAQTDTSTATYAANR